MDLNTPSEPRTQSLRKAEQQLESTHAELIPLLLIHSGSSAHGSSFPRRTAFPRYHLLSSDQKHHVALPGRHGRALQFSQRRMKVWTFGWRRIRELGSNFRRRKSSLVSSCPPPKAAVRADPSVVNFGSVSSSSLYLPACRCLRRHEDAIWDALPRRLSSSHLQDLRVLQGTMSKTRFVVQVQPVYDLKKHYCLMSSMKRDELQALRRFSEARQRLLLRQWIRFGWTDRLEYVDKAVSINPPLRSMKKPIWVPDLQGTYLINNLAPSSSPGDSLSHLGYCSFFPRHVSQVWMVQDDLWRESDGGTSCFSQHANTLPSHCKTMMLCSTVNTT